MPSGSKRKKAAKKKKGKETNSAPHSHQGDEDPKLDEVKDSDEDATMQSTEVVNSSSKVATGGKNDIQINQVIKLKDGSEPKNVTVEQVVHGYKSSSSSSSSGSSSDDESKFPNKKIEIINWQEPIQYAPSLGKTSDPPEITQVNEAISQNLAAVPPKNESFEAVSSEGNLGNSPKPADLPEVLTITEVVHVVDDKRFRVHLYEDSGSKATCESEISEVISTTKTNDSEDKSVKIVEENKCESISQDKVLVVDDLVKSKIQASNLASEVILSKEVNLYEDSGWKTNGKSEISEVPSTTKSVPIAETSNDAEHKKDPEVEYLDRKTQVAMPSRPVQVSSSCGCCGLFELFTGSNR